MTTASPAYDITSTDASVHLVEAAERMLAAMLLVNELGATEAQADAIRQHIVRAVAASERYGWWGSVAVYKTPVVHE